MALTVAKSAASSLHPVLKVGIGVGIGLSALATAWLLAANRVPFLDRFAFIRNIFALALAAGLLLVPVCRFCKSAGQLFLSGLIGWAMLSVAYSTLEIPFPGLAVRLSSFHLFMLGAVAFGLLATLAWLASLVMSVRQAPESATRRRLP